MRNVDAYRDDWALLSDSMMHVPDPANTEISPRASEGYRQSTLQGEQQQTVRIRWPGKHLK